METELRCNDCGALMTNADPALIFHIADGRLACPPCYRARMNPNQKPGPAQTPAIAYCGTGELLEASGPGDRELELQAMLTERAGYEAENAQRARTDSSPAYGADHFMELAQSIRNLKQPEQNTAAPSKDEKLEALVQAAQDIARYSGQKVSMGGIDDTRQLHIQRQDWETFKNALKEYQEACK